MKEEDIVFALDYYLSHLIDNKSGKFETRKIIKRNEVKEKVSQDYYQEHKDTTENNHNLFKNTIISFIKMFYGKNPSNFRTKTYQVLSTKFNKVIEENPLAEDKIKEIIKKNEIDINDFDEGGILENIYPKDMQSLYIDGMEHDDAALLLLGNNHVGVRMNARVYINPSSQYYYHLINYIYTESIKRELIINTKTRYDYNSNEGDHLVIYVAENQLGLFLNLLNDYEKENPEKIDTFNNSPLLLERNSHKWYGYGHEMFNTTLNTDVDTMFNIYILPLIFLEYFSKIFHGEKRNIIIQKIMDIAKRVYGENFDTKRLKDFLEMTPGRKSLIKDMISFKDHVARGQKTNPTLYKDDLHYIYKNGIGSNKLSNFLSTCFFIIMRDPEIRKEFSDFFSKKENYDKATKDIMYLQKQYSDQSTFLDGEPIYSSKELREEKNKYKRIVLDFAKLMATRKTYSNDDIHLFNKELESFINNVGGLDNIRIALEYSKGIELVNKNILEFVEQQLYGINGLYQEYVEESDFHR